MNSSKYDGVLYPVRETEDMRDIIMQSVEEFRDRAAYLIKEKHGEDFKPITYGEVGADVAALGTALIDMGLRGEKIGVIGGTCYEWLITYFATVCGVGVIVPLDKKLPPDELKSLVNRSGIKALIYTDKPKKSIKELFQDPQGIEFFVSGKDDSTENLSIEDLIEKGEDLIEDGDRRFLDAKVDPDELATLMFTSGTTGLAKGVMLSQRNIAANVKNMSKYVHLEEDMVVLSILPVHHAYAMTCVIWTTFYQGKTIAICEGIRYIQQNMVEVGAGCMVGVPLVFEKMYQGMWKQAKKRGEDKKLRNAIDFSRKFKLYNNRRLMKRMFKAIHQNFGGNMKLFIAGGAAIDHKVIEDFEAMGIPMIQGYGMSENGPIIAVNQDRYSIPASVGRAMPETEIKILNPDEDGVGEVATKGPSVMLGYYDNQEETDRVLQNGWLNTGDLGYIDDRDFLYLTGRKKTVIVTKGGKNIYPEEIETVLMDNDLIKEALVHGISDKNVGNTIIVADIFPDYNQLEKEEGKLNSGQIYNYYRKLVDRINKELPPYKMIKRVNIRENEFEKTTTGKIKRYGNFEEGSDIGKGVPELIDVKIKEQEEAEETIRRINESDHKYIQVRNNRPITDVKNLFTTSAELYKDGYAFVKKEKDSDSLMKKTYNDTLIDVNGIGTALINRGFENRKTGIIGDISYEWVTAYLAVTGGTGTAVPIDSNFNKTGIERIIKDADIEAIFCTREYLGILEDIQESGRTGLKLIIDFDGKDEEPEEGEPISWERLAKEGKKQVSKGDRQFIDAVTLASEIAAIHYTTGEGGRHKGVALSNHAIVDNIMNMASMVEINNRDIVASALPGHHSFECAFGVLTTLYRGAAVGVLSDNMFLEDNLRILEPSILLGSPSNIERLYKLILGQLYSTGTVRKFNRIRKRNRFFGGNIKSGKGFIRDLRRVFGGNIKTVVTVGDRIDADLLRFMNDIDIRSVQGYGLTESVAMVTINPNACENPESSGYALMGGEVRILSDKPESGNESEETGEICFRGNSLMEGYYKNQAATDEIMADGWLYTGDIGYISRGELYIRGRKSSLININGHIVSPEELEAKLRSVYFIDDAMVWKKDDALYATMVINRENIEDIIEEKYSEPAASALVGEEIHRMNQNLPEHKKIDRIILREREFEKTTGGKIRRDVLANREE